MSTKYVPLYIMVPDRGKGITPPCRAYESGSGMICGLDKGHSNDYHMAFGVDGKIPLTLWLTDEADNRRLTTPPSYEPPTIYPRPGDDTGCEIEAWIR